MALIARDKKLKICCHPNSLSLEQTSHWYPINRQKIGNNYGVNRPLVVLYLFKQHVFTMFDCMPQAL